MKITLQDVQRGYDDWAAQPHNAKWVRKIDGTPIANDIVVRIFTALSASPSDAERHERAVPDGWQLVPKEPNPNMLGAWYRYKSGVRFPDEPPATDTSDYGAYRAMLAAAPHPPAAVQEPMAVKVKTLDWKEGLGLWTAQTQFVACYSVWSVDDEKWQCSLLDGYFKSDTDAKAAAQSDYARKLRSALSTSQNDPAPEIAVLRAENERLKASLPEELTGKLQWAMHDAFMKSKADTVAGQMIDVYDGVRAAVAPEQEEAK